MRKVLTRARRFRRLRSAAALATAGALVTSMGWLVLASSPAEAVTEHCPADYTKVDQASGSTTFDFGNLTWGGTSLTYTLNTGVSLNICLKASNEATVFGPVTGTGTLSTPETGPMEQRQDISYIAYKLGVPPPPTDVCPNIPDVQATVPAGMVLDGQGNCVTPPPPTDVCPNIPDVQATVPAGMVLDGQGNCVTPPPPPPPPPASPEELIPAVTFTDATCDTLGEESWDGTLEAFLDYDATGEVGPGETVMVDAMIEPAYVDEYEFAAGAQTEFTHTFADITLEDCVEGEETVIPKPDKPEPKPDKKPVVKGVQVVAPPAAAPTAVAAGLAGDSGLVAGQLLGQALAGLGLVMLVAAGVLAPRRVRGVHEN